MLPTMGAFSSQWNVQFMALVKELHKYFFVSFIVMLKFILIT